MTLRPNAMSLEVRASVEREDFAMVDVAGSSCKSYPQKTRIYTGRERLLRPPDRARQPKVGWIRLD